MQTYAETASKYVSDVFQTDKSNDQSNRAVAEADHALRTYLEHKEPNYAAFEPLLEKLRKTSVDFVFLVFPTSAAKNTEERLWDAHVRVNKRFQKHLRQFRDGAGKKKHVERRKAEKHFLHFIKASMHFYRGYIQRLASHFANVPEIGLIAKSLHLDTLSVDPPISASTELKDTLITSCHNSLMRLGDLSRYRETELEHENRNWGPAKGHYQLALSIRPESGAAYNQLAVMALSDEDHLRAVYYLHRAGAAGKPFPVARDNIKLEFEKLLKFEPEDKPAITDISKQTLDVLENRFLAFHANCHRQPSEFLTFPEKATQLLQLVTLGFEEVSDLSLDKLIHKMCLINIAAEHLAWKGASETDSQLKLQADKVDKAEKATKVPLSKSDKKHMDKLIDEHQRNCQAFFLLQRFNILTFTTLLRMLARELGALQELAAMKVPEESTTIPDTVKRLLPHLRQYSSWLLSNIHAVLKPRLLSTQKCLDQFWKSYINAANLLLNKYPIADIPELKHLLQEDEDTLTFAPFSEKVSKWRYNFDNGPRKSVFQVTPTSERPINAEMLVRVRRFVFDAATITSQKEVLGISWAPIALNGLEFVHQERPITPPVEVIKPKTPSQPYRIRAHAHTGSMNGVTPAASPKPEVLVPGDRANTQTRKDAISAVVNQAPINNTPMESMVGNLVSNQAVNVALTPDQPLAGNRSPSFNDSSILIGTERPTSGSINIMDLMNIRGMQRSAEPLPPSSPPAKTSTHLSNPSLPGIWNTPFTPRPGETTGTSPRPGTASGFSQADLTQGSGARFERFMDQQEREIQLKTSPPPTFQMSSWPIHQATPAAQDQPPWGPSQRSSPWPSPAARSPSGQQRQLPQAALFGAIGEPRRNGSRTPINGQSG